MNIIDKKIEGFDKTFGKTVKVKLVGEYYDDDDYELESEGRGAGCDDCTTNMEWRDEIRSHFKQALIEVQKETARAMMPNERAVAPHEFEESKDQYKKITGEDYE